MLNCVLILPLLLLTACDAPPYVKRPPDRYLATGTVLLTTAKMLPGYCGKEAVACAPMDKSRRVFTLDPCSYSEEKYAATLCHELSHGLAGWPADHPD